MPYVKKLVSMERKDLITGCYDIIPMRMRIVETWDVWFIPEEEVTEDGDYVIIEQEQITNPKQIEYPNGKPTT